MTHDAPGPGPAWPEILTGLIAGDDLTDDRASWAMRQVMSGDATPGQIGGFLVGLRSKGVTGAEVAAFVAAMLDHAHLLEGADDAVDTCGTGGDGVGTVNISTMAAIVVAGTGRRVVKHGNRAASSRSGSADVLEALGIPLDLTPPEVGQCLRETGITFCFAPAFHPAMRFAGPVRRELGVPTVFNVLGPLANPARPAAQLVGVADAGLAPVVAQALLLRGTSALVVRGHDGLDEITTTTSTTIWDATGDEVVEHVVDVADLGLARPPAGALAGGDARYNAEVTEAVLADSPAHQAVVDAVCLNAGAALVAAGAVPAGTLQDRLGAGYHVARAAVADGAARDVLQRWRLAAEGLRSAQDPF
jgi:anthranilate phosphoribosyltransferase